MRIDVLYVHIKKGKKSVGNRGEKYVQEEFGEVK